MSKDKPHSWDYETRFSVALAFAPCKDCPAERVTVLDERQRWMYYRYAKGPWGKSCPDCEPLKVPPETHAVLTYLKDLVVRARRDARERGTTKWDQGRESAYSHVVSFIDVELGREESKRKRFLEAMEAGFEMAAGKSIEKLPEPEQERLRTDLQQLAQYREAALRAAQEHVPKRVPRLGVAVLASDDRDRVVLGRRGKEPNYHLWVLPGGGIQFGERWQDAALREFREETGLAIEVEGSPLVREVVGPDEHRVILFVEGKVVGGTPTPASDLTEVAFFRRDELPDDISPVVLPVLREFGWSKEH